MLIFIITEWWEFAILMTGAGFAVYVFLKWIADHMNNHIR